MNPFDECHPVVDLHMMKTAEINLFLLKGETQEISGKKIRLHLCFTSLFFGIFHGLVRCV